MGGAKMSKQKYIEAEKFVEHFGDWYTEEGTENGFIGTVKALVEQMPAADVAELRCGKWEKGKCSVCGFDWHNIQYEKTKVNKSPYCPNCGAKMRK